MSLLMFWTLCFVLLESFTAEVIAQCQFPNETNFENINFNQFQVACVTNGPEIDTYLTTVISASVSGRDFPEIIEAVCNQESGQWSESASLIQDPFLNVNLSQPCSSCSVVSGDPVCSPCHPDCTLNYELGSGRCIGNSSSDCCPYYNSDTRMCTTECPSDDISPEFICNPLPPAILISVDGQEFRANDQQNYYVFDPLEGSSDQLMIECSFEGSSSEISTLRTNSFWNVGFNDAAINSLVQSSPFEANLTDAVVLLSGINVSFIADSMDTEVSFDPMFTEDLTGLFRCHSSPAGLTVQSPVSINITTANPLLEFTNGGTALNLVFPVTSFNISGLVAEYRVNGIQRTAGIDNDLKVYYLNGTSMIEGDIELTEFQSRSYKVQFSEPLPSVVELVIELELPSGVTETVSLTVNSHGLIVQPSLRVEALVGSTVTLQCFSRVPGIIVSWGESQSSLLVLTDLENENSEIFCEVSDVSSFPSEAESSVEVTLLVYPSPVSIRNFQQNVFFPQPSLFSINGGTFKVTCNGLAGNTGLQWTTDYQGFNSDLSLLSPVNGSVTSSPGLNELTLSLTSLGYSNAVGNFTCTSLESGLSASVFLPGMSRYLSPVDYPKDPISIGQAHSITYLVAREADGLENGGLFDVVIKFPGTEIEFQMIPKAIESPQNPFTYVFDFFASSLFNNTVQAVLGDDEASNNLDLVVRGFPNIELVSTAPFRFIARKTVILQCSTSDNGAVISWTSPDQTSLPSPMYNVSQSSDGISTLALVPYIYSFRLEDYPPQDLMLSNIGPIDATNWVQIPDEEDVVCSVCDRYEPLSSCAMSTLIDPQTITVEPLFHPVTWVAPNSQLYNGSVRSDNLDGITLTCKSTEGNGNLGLRTNNEALNQYFSAGMFEVNFTFSNNTSVSVDVLGDYDVQLRVIGVFDPVLSGEYVCFSRESGMETSVLLTTEEYYVEFVEPSPVTFTLGTSVFIRYRSSASADGSPSGSRDTFGYLAVSSPEGGDSNVNNYEVSPYNYGLYLDVLRSTDGGNYTVSIDDDGSPLSPRTILLEIEFPTISVPIENVTIREGENATLYCNPSDPNVQLIWSEDPPTSNFISSISSNDVEYDNLELRHSVTIIRRRSDQTFYCYVKGDLTSKTVSPGAVSLRVRRRCDQTLLAGVLFDTFFEGDVVSFPCRDMSDKFIDSASVRGYRTCGMGGVQSSTCTLAEGTTAAFAVVDISVLADNTSVVMKREKDILTEVRFLLVGNTSLITDLYVTRYIAYGSNIGVVMEALFDPVYTAPSLYYFYNSEVVAGFLLSSRSFTGFEPSNICECTPTDPPQVVPMPVEEESEELSRREVEPVLESNGGFPRLCVGVLVEPCVCGDTTCQCQTPFIGDGELCTVDSDSDDYPDTAIPSQTCNGTASMSPNYCFNDTCPSIYNPEQNPPVCETTVADGCVAEVDQVYGIQWPSSPVNTTVTQACGGSNVIGLATRYCDSDGEWLRASVSSCISREFSEISTEASAVFDTPAALLNTSDLIAVSASARDLINQLAVATDASEGDASLFPSELSLTNDILTDSISVLLEDFNRNGNTSNINESSFADVFSNLLDIRNDGAWEDLQDDTPSMGSELLLDNAEDFGLLLATSLETDESVVVVRENIVINANQVSVPADEEIPSISFPDIDEEQENYLDSASIVIPGELLQERAMELGTTSLSVVNILFNNLQEYLETANTSSTMETGSLILSSQVGKQTGTADFSNSLQEDPISLSFTILPENFSNPLCVFWQFSTPVGNGFWSSSGVETIYDEGTNSVACLSQHLTSFAVLVDTTGVTNEITGEESLALSIVTYFGLSISIVCLVLTVLFFLTFGKQLFSSVHNFVHLNLAVALLFAYLVFICGIETATDSKAACTVVAALLHYFFLSAFCWMLCEGLMLYLMLVVVFSTLSKKWWFFLLLGWFPPLLPVVVTVGVAHDYYTDGEHFCWLSVEENVIWAFVVPMIVIILINVVFFVMVLYSLIKNRGSKDAMKLKESHKIDVVKSTFKASLILLPLLGLTWVFGLLAVVEHTTVFAWIFTILNAFQGAAIFFFHVIRNDRVWNRLSKKYKELSSKSGDYSISENSSSSANEKKRKYFKPKSTSSTAAGSYSKNQEYELAPIEPEPQEADFEKEKTIDNEYVPVGPNPTTSNDEEEKIDLSKEETDAEVEHRLRYTMKIDPNALVDNA